MVRIELETLCEEDDYALNNILRLDFPIQISSQKIVGSSRVKLFISDVHCQSNKRVCDEAMTYHAIDSSYYSTKY